jgi:hypothetical protein
MLPGRACLSQSQLASGLARPHIARLGNRLAIHGKGKVFVEVATSGAGEVADRGVRPDRRRQQPRRGPGVAGHGEALRKIKALHLFEPIAEFPRRALHDNAAPLHDVPPVGYCEGLPNMLFDQQCTNAFVDCFPYRAQ